MTMNAMHAVRLNPSPLVYALLAVWVGLAVPPAVWAQGTAAITATTTEPAPAGSSSPALKSRTPVTVNFVNADVEAVTRAFAAMIERQIAVDPRVKGSITVYSEQPLTVRQAYLNYLSALRGLGFAMVENAGLLKVVPEADAKLRAGTVSVGEAPTRNDQVMTQIFTLRHENPNNLVTVLRPLITANNTINASPGTNTLVITDYADNLQRLGKIIAALDQPSLTDFEVIPLKHAIASDLAVLVQRLADTSAAAAGAPGAGSAAARPGRGSAAGPASIPGRTPHPARGTRRVPG